MKRDRGFTLLELMIVVAVVAILATIALSAYQKQVRKSRRAEAKQVLADLGLQEEKYRSNNTTYGTLAQVGGAPTMTYYSICPAAVVASCTNSTTGYVMIAVPLNDQLKDTCGNLTWTMASGVVTKSPITACW